MRKIKNPKIGEYVLITKYSDHDPGDPWALGWFTRKGDWRGKTTYYIKDECGQESTYPKFKNCFRLSIDEGRDWLSYYKAHLDNKYCDGIRTPDCYYKQLQQKSQELKELKAYFKELNNFSATYAADSVLLIAKYKQAIDEVKKLASEPYSLPCCGNCKYPNCFDKVSKYGKNCMELKLMKIKEICSEVQK